jgi:hypothetical protein
MVEGGGGGGAPPTDEPSHEAAAEAVECQEEEGDWASVTTAGSQVDLESTGADGVSLGDTASDGGGSLAEDGAWDSDDSRRGERNAFVSSQDMLQLPVVEQPGTFSSVTVAPAMGAARAATASQLL